MGAPRRWLAVPRSVAPTAGGAGDLRSQSLSRGTWALANGRGAPRRRHPSRGRGLMGTIEELRRLVEGAAARRPHLTSRLEKAAFLVLLRPIHQLRRDTWRVGSEDGLRFYCVRGGECECSDYLRHGGGHPCKHRLALFLHRSLGAGGNQATGRGSNRCRLDDDVPRGLAC